MSELSSQVKGHTPRSMEQITQEREMCRLLLAQTFSGPNGAMVKDYIWSLLDLGTLYSTDVQATYFNLGKLKAIETLLEEAQKV